MKKVLITGASGFAGSHLVDYLVLKKEYDITGTYLSEQTLDNLSDSKDKIKLSKLDLLNNKDVSSLIEDLRPDYVFHLAALSSAGDSFKNPFLTINNNISAQLNILESLRIASLLSTKILIVSSAEVYGRVEEKDLPIDEETSLKPDNPYGVSKIAQDFLGLQYNIAYEMPIIRVRPFNHIGARQTGNFVVSSFAKKIAMIEKGKMSPVLKVGNLNTKRDFTDVSDVVRAYDILMKKGKPGEVYNIGSGTSCKISDILDMLLSFSNIAPKIEVDKDLLRPSDIPNLVCDSSKIKKETGWEAQVNIEETLRRTLDYWRKIV